ncbi:MAG: galactose-1-phosphate uridylyltransferase [Endomicrobiales bacterium]|nr:galactose-1-phosphate uridylyltransferase [Endomicrobiales bacterium]
MSEFRRDPVIGRWVIITTDRSRRPSDFIKECETEPEKVCPFCPGNEKMTPPSILVYNGEKHSDDSSKWSLRVVPNKYPALAVEGSLERQGEGMYDKISGIGAHEVIIESPDHNKGTGDLSDEHINDIFRAFRERILDLKRDIRFEYIIVFKNSGKAAGANLSHPHSQLIATPIIPRRVKGEMKGSLSYYEYKERCIFCDIIREEMSSASRIITENSDFVAFCPFASRSPFEVWVLPKNHGSHFESINDNDISKLSSIMKDVLKKLGKVLDNPPFNYTIHNSPLKEPNLPYYHWHIEIIPKLIQVAGFEWGTGFFINPTPPEEAAAALRESE